MKNDMNDLKKLVFDLLRRGEADVSFQETNSRTLKDLFRDTLKEERSNQSESESPSVDYSSHKSINNIQDTEEIIEESLSLADKEVEMIKKALEKYNGKRKMAAGELGISERTLYRKIKEYGIES
jgi:DNA-binding NtrC family response regulator